MRNIGKISPKMAQKQPFSDFFLFSQKLSIRFERNFLQWFYTILESYMCNEIKIAWPWYEKHSQNYPKNSQETAIFRLLSDFASQSESLFKNSHSMWVSTLCAWQKEKLYSVRLARQLTKHRLKTAQLKCFRFFSTSILKKWPENLKDTKIHLEKNMKTFFKR